MITWVSDIITTLRNWLAIIWYVSLLHVNNCTKGWTFNLSEGQPWLIFVCKDFSLTLSHSDFCLICSIHFFFVAFSFHDSFWGNCSIAPSPLKKYDGLSYLAISLLFYKTNQWNLLQTFLPRVTDFVYVFLNFVIDTVSYILLTEPCFLQLREYSCS